MVKKSKAPLVISILNVIFVAYLAFYFSQHDLLISIIAAVDVPLLLTFSILAYRKESGWAIVLIVFSVLLLPVHILTLVAGIKIRGAEKERAELAKDHPIPMARDLKLAPLPEDEGWASAEDVAYFRPLHDEDIFKYFGRAQAIPAVTKIFERKRVLLTLILDDESKRKRIFECLFVTEYGEKVGDRTYVMFYNMENGERDYDTVLNYARIGRAKDGKTFLQVVSDYELIKRLKEDFDILYGEQIRREYERLQKERAKRARERQGMLSDLGDVFGTLFMSDPGVRVATERFKGNSGFAYSCTYTNSMGYQQTVYTNDKIKFYRENGEYVGYSEDGGRTIIEE